MGFLLFADLPNQTTLIGGMVISASTIWVARRDARYNRDAQAAQARRDASDAEREVQDGSP